MSKCQFCQVPCQRSWCPFTLTTVSGIALALFLGLFNLLASTEVKNDYAIFDKIRKSTTQVWVLDYEGRPKSFGTGVLIKTTNNYSYVLTNDHVCGHDSGERKIIRRGLMQSEGQVIKSSTVSDLCLLQLAPIPGHTAILRNNPNNPGEKVYIQDHSQIVIGIRQGMFQTGILGELMVGFSNGADMANFRSFFQQVYPGASGSGVYNQDSELVGLVSRTLTGKNVSFMVDLHAIKKFLSDVKFQ